MPRPWEVVWFPEHDVVIEPGFVRARFITEHCWLPTDMAESILQGAAGTRVSVTYGPDGWYNAIAVPQGDPGDLMAQLESLFSGLVMLPEHMGGPDMAFALDWYTELGSALDYTDTGRLERRAKWSDNSQAAGTLAAKMASYAAHHERIAASGMVLVVESSHSLSKDLGTAVASRLGVPLAVCTKIDRQHRQRDATSEREFQDIFQSPRGRWELPSGRLPSTVVVIDDLCRSGGTLAEVARCLRERGVDRVWALVAVKSVKHQRQT
ncbi:MAG: phosphoribosyltransferase [Chloroflexi bacterium]|nr:phosphoribosyltransferase [Chloroflexota bacterium]